MATPLAKRAIFPVRCRSFLTSTFSAAGNSPRASVDGEPLRAARRSRHSTLPAVVWALVGWMLVLAAPAAAQLPADVDGSNGVSSFSTAVNGPWPGNFWISATGAEEGLGYEGSYFSAGGLYQINAQGWFGESRAHVSENGGFFGNFGLGKRVLTPGGDMFGLSFWYDYDGDRWANFGHDFHQVGISGEIINPAIELRLNGYLPIANTGHNLGTGSQCFFGHQILARHGVDSALAGMDGEIGMPIGCLSPWGSMFYVGGYFYGSDEVDTFGGASFRFLLYPADRMATQLVLNNDTQFNLSGMLQVAVYFNGVSRRGGNPVLRRTQRNDHIVRVHHDPVVAIDPDTGLPYRVVHVDNRNTAGGNGTFERPYGTLAAAEAASINDDVIFVREGDGTSTGYDAGITLKTRQMLLGDGVAHVIPTLNFGDFTLCSHADGRLPLIGNAGGAAVTLADDTVVSGINVSGAMFGIRGSGLTQTTIHNNIISAAMVDGIFLDNSTGVFNVTDNLVAGSAQNGVNLQNVAGEVNVLRNFLSNNGTGTLAGLFVDNASGTSAINVRENSFEGNGTGISVTSRGAGTQIDLTIDDNVAINNSGEDGVALAALGGSTLVSWMTDSTISGNGTSANGGLGIRLTNVDSVLSVLMDNLTLTDNLGDPDAGFGGTTTSGVAGIYGSFSGNGNTTLSILNTSITGGSGQNDAVQFEYAVTNASVNSLILANTSLSNSTSDGIFLVTSSNTRLNIDVNNSSILNNEDEGFDLLTSGTSVVQFSLVDTSVNDNQEHGVSVDLSDTSRVIGSITTSMINGNGAELTDEGLGVEANDASVLVLDLDQNSITGNADEAIQFDTFDTARVFAFLTSNDLRSSGGTQSFLATVNALQSANGICVHLANNASDNVFQLNNDGDATSSFLFEDGGSNIGAIVTGGTGPGTVNAVATGTCAAAAVPFRSFP